MKKKKRVKGKSSVARNRTKSSSASRRQTTSLSVPGSQDISSKVSRDEELIPLNKRLETDVVVEVQRKSVRLYFSAEALQRLDALKEETGAATTAEVISKALRVYDWLVNEVDPDKTIAVLDKNTIKLLLRSGQLTSEEQQ
jgi:hypothetical protein